MKMLRLPRYVNRFSISLAAIAAIVALSPSLGSATTGACAAPSTDYGTVTSNVNITGTGTYRIWSRVAIPSAMSSAYSLEIDGNNCFAVNGSTLTAFASGATTFFSNNTSNWVGTQTGGASLTMNLSAGTHTVKLIGTSANVVVDRLIFTQDTTCIPTGFGTNCSSPPDTTPPVVTMTAPAGGASLGASTTVSANATDDTAVTKVEFYIDSTLIGTDTSANVNSYSVTLANTGLSAGTHNLKAIAYDAAGNSATSSLISVTVPGTGGGTTTYNTADINTDGSVNYLDLSLLASNYGKTGSAITPARADINSDGTVNYLDLSVLASNYGK